MADDGSGALPVDGTSTDVASGAPPTAPLPPGASALAEAVTETARVMGAQAALAGDDIAMSPDEVAELGRRLFGALQTVVDHEHAQFLGAPREAAVFGATPEAHWFSTQLGAAHDVVASAVAGLRDDLRAFQERLVAAAAAARTADESAEEALLRFAQRGESAWAMSRQASVAGAEHGTVLELHAGPTQHAATELSLDEETSAASGEPPAGAAPTPGGVPRPGSGDTAGGFEGG